ncbi:hypothetical protein ACWF50_13095 [Brucella pseudogrignonensis]
MKNFGKLTPISKRFDIPGPTHINENGDAVHGPMQSVNVSLFCTKDGKDICDAAKDDPHPFYIAVNEDGLIFSMTDDIEHSQLCGFDVIGIDSNYGFTFGPGGTVYGKKWTGSEIVDPISLMTVEELRTIMPELERWRLNVVINLRSGLHEKIVAGLEALPDPSKTIALAKIADKPTFLRTDPLFDQILSIPEIGLTDEDIDALWKQAAKLN